MDFGIRMNAKSLSRCRLRFWRRLW